MATDGKSRETVCEKKEGQGNYSDLVKFNRL